MVTLTLVVCCKVVVALVLGWTVTPLGVVKACTVISASVTVTVVVEGVVVVAVVS